MQQPNGKNQVQSEKIRKSQLNRNQSGKIGTNQKKSVLMDSQSGKIGKIGKNREKSEKNGINQKKSGLLGFGTRSNLIPPQRRGIGKNRENRENQFPKQWKPMDSIGFKRSQSIQEKSE